MKFWNYLLVTNLPKKLKQAMWTLFFLYNGTTQQVGNFFKNLIPGWRRKRELALVRNELFEAHIRRRRSFISKILCEGLVGGGCKGNLTFFILYGLTVTLWFNFYLEQYREVMFVQCMISISLNQEVLTGKMGAFGLL